VLLCNSSRRLDKEAMNDRDAEAWELQQKRGWSVREIARELQMPASSVQRCLQRTQKRLAAEQAETDRALSDELDAALAKYDDGGMTAEDVQTASDIPKLNALEYHRLRYCALDSPQQRAWAEAVKQGWRPPPREPVTYPIDDGYSWRAGVAVARGDPEPEADEW
jgi:hypothetical protein